MRHLASTSLVTVLSLLLSAGNADDWVSWRGPHQNGTSDEEKLPSSWSESGKNLLWKAPFGCRSTPVVFNNRVYMIDRGGEGVHEQERVVCLDASTGKLVWENRWNIYLTNIPNARAGWANVAVDPATGYVYAHGVGGVFRCLDKAGKVLWSKSLTEQYGRLSGYGGRTNSPVIFEDLVLLNYTNSSWGPFNKPSQRYWGFDKLTGENIYVSAPAGKFMNSTYSTAVVVYAGGQDLLIDANSDGYVHAIKVRTGEKVWKYRLSLTALQASVVVSKGRIYATEGDELPEGGNIRGRLACLDAATGREIWKHDGIRAGYASPGVYRDNVYVMDNYGNLHCLDARSGKYRWKKGLGTVGKGSPAFGDDKCYVTTVDGRLHIVKLNDKESKVKVHTVELYIKSLDGSPRKPEVYGSPAIANGRVYFPTETMLYCVGKIRPSKSSSLRRSSAVNLDTNRPAAYLRVSPGDGLARTGRSLAFNAATFDARGRFIRNVQPKWSLLGLKGTISDSGVFSTPSGSRSQAGMVQAKLGTLTSKVRLRVVADTGLTEDFESYKEGKAPVWFVGAGKFKLKKLNGNRKLFKPVPPRGLARSYAYIGAPDMQGYTIEADMMGKEYKRRMPDCGLLCCRYIVDLVGNHQKIQIRTWPGSAPPRFQVDKRFRWDPEVWYRMKVRVDPTAKPGEARIRVKVWKTAAAEPKNWTIDALDACGNIEGAPGISGFNGKCDIYFDNVVVKPSR